MCSPHISAAPKNRPIADGGQEQQRDDRLGIRRRPAQDRPQRAADQRQPQQQADEQEPLPEAAHVGVFPALVAEPEVVLQPELLHHRQPLAGERADHDDQQADEQEVDAEPLELRLMAGQRRCDVQAGAEPRDRDPQHRQLRVPGARERVGQHVGQREAVGLLAFDLVVRGDRAEQDLHQEQRQHDPEVLRGRAHRRRDPQQRERIGWRESHAAPRRGRG